MKRDQGKTFFESKENARLKLLRNSMHLASQRSNPWSNHANLSQAKYSKEKLIPSSAKQQTEQPYRCNTEPDEPQMNLKHDTKINTRFGEKRAQVGERADKAKKFEKKFDDGSRNFLEMEKMNSRLQLIKSKLEKKGNHEDFGCTDDVRNTHEEVMIKNNFITDQRATAGVLSHPEIKLSKGKHPSKLIGAELDYLDERILAEPKKPEKGKLLKTNDRLFISSSEESSSNDSQSKDRIIADVPRRSQREFAYDLAQEKTSGPAQAEPRRSPRKGNEKAFTKFLNTEKKPIKDSRTWPEKPIRSSRQAAITGTQKLHSNFFGSGGNGGTQKTIGATMNQKAKDGEPALTGSAQIYTSDK
jgi:hypothetical protein